MTTKLALSIATAALVCAAAAETAAAEYSINSCQSAKGFSTRAFGHYATRGMKWRRACKPQGPGQRGLIVSNVIRRKRVKRGAVALFVLRAAPGTAFTMYTWSGRLRRVDCNYTIEIYAVRPPGAPGRRLEPITGKTAGRGCPRRGHAQISRKLGGVYGINGATTIVQRIICAGRPSCSARGVNYIKTRRSSVKAVNTSRPQVAITGGDLVSGGWVTGARSVEYSASDDVGVRRARLIVGGGDRGGEERSCDDSVAVPCPSGPGRLGVNAKQAPEGTQQVVVQAEDAAGNVGNSSPGVARIDNTPPTAVPIELEGGEDWRNANGFAARWANPREVDRAPIAAAHYRLCRAGGPCREAEIQRGPSISRLAGVQVPAPGDWVLRMWREDEAGNRREADASPPVRLRYDPEAPTLAIEPVAPDDPTLVGVKTEDPLSGVAGGQVELSREGSGAWSALETRLEGDRLTARIDDSSLPAGRYLLRARADDRAGNNAITDRRADGSPAIGTLPLRAEARLRTGFARRRTVRRVVRRRGRRRAVRRRVTKLEPAARVRRGRRVTVAGVLRGAGNGALASAAVHVLERPEGGTERLLGSVATDARGRFHRRVRARTNATLRVAYLGTAVLRGTQRALALSVPARSSLRISRRRLLNGQAEVFGGRVVPRPALAAGKLVELQTLLSGRWQTFRTVRADPRGRWRTAYRFRRTSGTVRYRFRARLPREAGYPFATGRTRAVSVTVRGR